MYKAIASAVLAAAFVLGMNAPALARGHFGFTPVPGFHHGLKVGWGRGHVPPGWHRGRKVGWGRGHVPPGLRRRVRRP
jgi:hypothetical protein